MKYAVMGVFLGLGACCQVVEADKKASPLTHLCSNSGVEYVAYHLPGAYTHIALSLSYGRDGMPVPCGPLKDEKE